MEAKKKEKVRRHNPLTCGKRGGDDGIRTHDPHVANVMLSQLSYIPTKVCAFAQGSSLPDFETIVNRFA